MQSITDVINKIRREEQELDDKIRALEYFMMTSDYTQISSMQKNLLNEQHKVMTAYKLILVKRARLLNLEDALAESKKATE